MQSTKYSHSKAEGLLACLSPFTGIFWEKFVKVTLKISSKLSFCSYASAVLYVRMKTGQIEQKIIFLMRLSKTSAIAVNKERLN